MLLTHAGATLALVGLIWTIQVVHYPLFAKVGGEAFHTYEQAHVSRVTLVVAPLMFVELLCALAIVAMRPAGVSPGLAWTGFALLAIVWISTATLQGPMHGRLASLGVCDPKTHSALVSTNWIRTVAWSARGGIALAMLWQGARATMAGS
ncbi:MAG: hypothetical protein AAGD00_09270 [Planctomycetota bacterium]